MRLRSAVGLTAAALTAVLGLPVPAATAETTTLYVTRSHPACSDAGTGTKDVPFCTIGAAAKVVQPGQTVRIGQGSYAEQVDLTRSGTPGRPITFTGTVPAVPGRAPDVRVGAEFGAGATSHAFTLNGVHDVDLTGMYLLSKDEQVTVTNSSAVTMDRLAVWGSYTADPRKPAAVAVTGACAGVTISRGSLWNTGGVSIGAGVQGAVVTTNDIGRTQGAAGISVTDAPGTVVTSNTVTGTTGSGVVLAGASTGAVLMNNVISGNGTANAPDAAQIAVSAGSASGTRVDYNLTGAAPAAYAWAGRLHDLPAFRAATGQGAHDIDDTPAFSGANLPNRLEEGSPGIDSADPTAPGVLATDLLGHRVADDPKVADSGPQGTARDRGAYEFLGLTEIVASLDFRKGPYPLAVNATVTARNSWPTSPTYSYDFGDGSAPVVTTATTVPHTYTTKGTYQLVVTAGDDTGQQLASLTAADGATAGRVVVGDPGPLRPVLTVTPDFRLLGYTVDTRASTDPWEITDRTIDFGDGTPVLKAASDYVSHTYSAPGSYPVTVTLTDAAGRTASATTTVSPAYDPAGYVAVTPHRLEDTRVPSMVGLNPLKPGETRSFSAYTPSGATATVLNVTAVNATAETHLDVLPWGARPSGTSNLNVGPGRTVANLVTVPSGEFSITNHSGTVDVVVDLFGYYKPGATDRFTPLTPARLLDTRQGAGAKVGPGASVPVQIAGAAGIPADVSAVVLNVTATEPTDTGYLAVRPGGQSGRPGTSNLNFAPGQTVPNQVIVPVGPDGKVEIFNNSGGTHVIADVAGYYGPGGKGLFTPVPPTRLTDTRTGPGTPLGAYGTLPVQVGGAATVPADAVAGVFNLTVTGPAVDGHLTAYPDGAAVPGTSSLNFTAGATASNHAQVPLGTGGRLDLRNGSYGSTHVIADLFGYFTNA
ncbi:hypothetical protein GCM10010495_36290 [Kitasatospora herbaricolor]|uniref:PKD domain-containing protein n=1 Tax=Kitasatospora herbaricolor TaxID=68217 RepID=UPI00174AA334|nr:PKD domain-containing protein [Kitasatospora herbaricolor]MDQ0310169.1 parallel beta-helix repeat protein [Kitasatospora herbaricolor]GGV18201.1 hypothetical protein GCM10010495_36290 [Kitasatospora herbaricolor]